MGLFGKIFSNKKKEEDLNKRGQIKRLATSKLKKINNIRLIEKRFEEFVSFFRIFIEKTFHIKKNFTYEELKKELKNKRIKRTAKTKIRDLLLDIYEIEFKGQKITKEKMNKMMEKFKEVIELI